MTPKKAFEKFCESEKLSRSDWWLYWPYFKAGYRCARSRKAPPYQQKERAAS